MKALPMTIVILKKRTYKAFTDFFESFDSVVSWLTIALIPFCLLAPIKNSEVSICNDDSIALATAQAGYFGQPALT